MLYYRKYSIIAILFLGALLISYPLYAADLIKDITKVNKQIDNGQLAGDQVYDSVLKNGTVNLGVFDIPSKKFGIPSLNGGNRVDVSVAPLGGHFVSGYAIDQSNNFKLFYYDLQLADILALAPYREGTMDLPCDVADDGTVLVRSYGKDGDDMSVVRVPYKEGKDILFNNTEIPNMEANKCKYPGDCTYAKAMHRKNGETWVVGTAWPSASNHNKTAAFAFKLGDDKLTLMSPLSEEYTAQPLTFRADGTPVGYVAVLGQKAQLALFDKKGLLPPAIRKIKGFAGISPFEISSNSKGMLLMTAYLESDLSQTRAILYTPQEGFINLNDMNDIMPNVTFTYAYDLSDKFILVRGIDDNGDWSQYVLHLQ